MVTTVFNRQRRQAAAQHAATGFGRIVSVKQRLKESRFAVRTTIGSEF